MSFFKPIKLQSSRSLIIKPTWTFIGAKAAYSGVQVTGDW